MNKEKDKDNDISELNIPHIERYLESHKKEIMDHIMNKIFKDKPQITKISGEIFFRLYNEITKDVPFGSMIHLALANAVMYSLWSGFQSERLKKVSNFRDEYIEQIQDVINRAFNTGRNYASEIAT